MKRILIIAILSALCAFPAVAAELKTGESVLLCQDGSSVAIVQDAGECQGKVHEGTVSVVGQKSVVVVTKDGAPFEVPMPGK